MAKRLNPNKAARTLPDSKRVQVSGGQVKTGGGRPAPVKTTEISD